jgi:hypothetical protein
MSSIDHNQDEFEDSKFVHLFDIWLKYVQPQILHSAKEVLEDLKYKTILTIDK